MEKKKIEDMKEKKLQTERKRKRERLRQQTSSLKIRIRNEPNVDRRDRNEDREEKAKNKEIQMNGDEGGCNTMKRRISRGCSDVSVPTSVSASGKKTRILSVDKFKMG